MKLIEIVTAYTALQTLSDVSLPAQTAYDIFMMKQNLRGETNYFLSEEMKLAKKYAAKREDGQPDIRDGRVYFAGETDEERMENAKAYNEARAKLCGVEADYKYKNLPAVLRIPAGAKVTVALLEALAPVAKVVIDGTPV